jgi:histidyl-tRNA synthetase
VMEAVGIERGNYVIKVNNRKVLDGVMEAIGLGGPENAGRRLTVLRAIDKLDRLGIDGVRSLLGAGRRDSSGDFTLGSNLSTNQIDSLVAILTKDIDRRPDESEPVSIGGRGPFGVERAIEAGQNRDMHQIGAFSYLSNARTLDFWERAFDASPTAVTGIGELRELASLCDAAGYGSERIRVDSSVVRGLEYYTGPVFEAELTFETKDEEGRTIGFGSVGGGGRYDGLVSRFREEPVPATGFSIGVSRLLAALRAIDSPILKTAETPGPVVVLALDRDPQSLANYQRLVASLRRAGIASELYLGQGGMNAQLKYADKRMSRCAVIQGSNERNAPGGPLVTIRDLKLGAELAKATKDRADYLELRRRAQFSAPEAELIERVREVLARP